MDSPFPYQIEEKRAFYWMITNHAGKKLNSRCQPGRGPQWLVVTVHCLHKVVWPHQEHSHVPHGAPASVGCARQQALPGSVARCLGNTPCCIMGPGASASSPAWCSGGADRQDRKEANWKWICDFLAVNIFFPLDRCEPHHQIYCCSLQWWDNKVGSTLYSCDKYCWCACCQQGNKAVQPVGYFYIDNTPLVVFGTMLLGSLSIKPTWSYASYMLAAT